MISWDQDQLRDSEAREWIRRHKKKVNDLGLYEARLWWERNIAEIARIRGQAAADDLKARMNRIKNEKSSKG